MAEGLVFEYPFVDEDLRELLAVDLILFWTTYDCYRCNDIYRDA